MAGAFAGGIAAVLAPSSADRTFFSATAQVVPVVLIALALELRIFGIARRIYRVESRAPSLLEAVRWTLALLMMGVILSAEFVSVDALTSGSADPWVVYLALAWAFVTVALAVVIGPRSRVIPFLAARRITSNEYLVVVAANNDFGERDLRPLMNLLLPDPGVEIYGADSEARRDTRPLEDLMKNPESITGGDGRHTKVVDGRPLVSAGDAFLQHYVVAVQCLRRLSFCDSITTTFLGDGSKRRSCSIRARTSLRQSMFHDLRPRRTDQRTGCQLVGLGRLAGTG